VLADVGVTVLAILNAMRALSLRPEDKVCVCELQPTAQAA